MSLDKKYLQVEMPDGKLFAVPVMIIAQHRANYYHGRLARHVSRDEALTATLRVFNEDQRAITEWAGGNMDWDEVKDHAVEIETIPPGEPDYQNGWVNGPKVIITEAEKNSTDANYREESS